MEHLSPEERACLMYLEEMIDGLEVQEDSGLSNDEPDPPFQAGRGANGMFTLLKYYVFAFLKTITRR